ncbi:MAG: hypothetical protein KGO05_05295, partial [Chloroflexota bacterium]|nr:hypothetical protein [Chloroflexota bacterium]
MTHAEFETELVEALNMLLEDERASVEMEISLASGATEYAERDAITAMGVEDIHFCEQLRTEMEVAGLPVTPQINGVVFHVIGAERYDDRLRAFAQHQRAVADHARELQESNLDGALREALDGISTTHERHSDWIEQRADAFAATRALEFGAPTQLAQPPVGGETYTTSRTISEATAAPEPPGDYEAAPADDFAVETPAAYEAAPPTEEPPAKPRATRAATPRASASRAKSAAKAPAKARPAAKPRATAKA